MEQIVLHLLADHVFITNWMTNNKTRNVWVALIHSLIYTVCFALFFALIHHVLHPVQVVLIFAGHFLIDYFHVVRYVLFAKNWLSNRDLIWKHCKTTGNPHSVPQHIAAQNLFIVDLTLHLLVNYLILHFL